MRDGRLGKLLLLLLLAAGAGVAAVGGGTALQVQATTHFAAREPLVAPRLVLAPCSKVSRAAQRSTYVSRARAFTHIFSPLAQDCSTRMPLYSLIGIDGTAHWV